MILVPSLKAVTVEFKVLSPCAYQLKPPESKFKPGTTITVWFEILTNVDAYVMAG
jgi:hypothetical protein